MLATKTIAAINKYLEDNQESSHRKHLGASVIGRPCGRAIWYLFRWAKDEKFEGRLLRLFDRGEKEEARFFGYLRNIGCEVWTHQGEEQFHITDHMGHFGGSLDGVIRGIPEMPNEVILGECKTHNDKSFKKLTEAQVIEAKHEHFIQMQIYMRKLGFKHALYMATNKNDDDYHFEIIGLQPDVADRYIERAKMIIFSEMAPPRINNSPGWWQCTFCVFKDICHNREVAEINCRTCAFSTPIEKKKWHCSCTTEGYVFREDNLILYQGCHRHIYHPDMIGGARLQCTDPNKEFIEILRDDKILRIGPKHLSSQDLYAGGPF